MAEVIYVMGAYGFLCVSGRFWHALIWPVFLGEMAASHFQSQRIQEVTDRGAAQPEDRDTHTVDEYGRTGWVIP